MFFPRFGTYRGAVFSAYRQKSSPPSCNYKDQKKHFPASLNWSRCDLHQQQLYELQSDYKRQATESNFPVNNRYQTQSHEIQQQRRYSSTIVTTDEIPGTKSDRNVFVLVYTCETCHHREVKKITKNAYQHGIVIVQCGNCKSRHLIADHLNWFTSEKTTVEDLMLRKGNTVIKTIMQHVGDDDVESNESDDPSAASNLSSINYNSESESESGTKPFQAGSQKGPLVKKKSSKYTVEVVKSNGSLQHFEVETNPLNSDSNKSQSMTLLDNATMSPSNSHSQLALHEMETCHPNGTNLLKTGNLVPVERGLGEVATFNNSLQPVSNMMELRPIHLLQAFQEGGLIHVEGGNFSSTTVTVDNNSKISSDFNAVCGSKSAKSNTETAELNLPKMSISKTSVGRGVNEK